MTTAVLGRKSTYRPEYAQMLLDYIDQGEEPFNEVEKKHKNRKGEEWTEDGKEAMPLRFIGRFAQRIGVTHKCLLGWAERFPDFGEAYSRAREIQAEHILQCGFMGLADATMAKFAAVNLTDLRDKAEHTVNVSEEAKGLLDWVQGRELPTTGQPALPGGVPAIPIDSTVVQQGHDEHAQAQAEPTEAIGHTKAMQTAPKPIEPPCEPESIEQQGRGLEPEGGGENRDET